MPLTRSAKKKRKAEEQNQNSSLSHDNGNNGNSRSKLHLEHISSTSSNSLTTATSSSNDIDDSGNSTSTIIITSSRKRCPFTKLYRLFGERSWNEMINYLETEQGKEDARVGVSYKTRFFDLGTESKTLILHEAVRYMVPLNVIWALVKAYPEGAKKEDDRGDIPLHLLFTETAQSSCSSSRRQYQVLQVLLDAYPDGPKHQNRYKGHLPLHYACMEGQHVARDCLQKLIDMYPESVTRWVASNESLGARADPVGDCLPIHFASLNYMKYDIDILVKAYPDSLHERSIRDNLSDCTSETVTTAGYTPIELCLDFCRCPPYGFMEKLIRSSFLYLLQATYPIDPLVDHQKFYTISPTNQKKKKNKTLLANKSNIKEKIMCHGSAINDTFLILHFALLCGAPFGIIKHIVYLYERKDRQDILFEKNMYGELPIHCALETNNVSGAFYVGSLIQDNNNDNNHDDDIDERIIVARRTKNACMIANTTDKKGRLPIHVAINNYGKYDDRQNQIIFKFLCTMLHEEDTLNQKMSLDTTILYCSDNKQQQIIITYYPLQAYLLKLASIQDADPMLGCEGNVYFCPLIVQFLMKDNPVAVQTTCHCKRIRNGYQMLISKNQQNGVELYPFQLLCLLLSSDVRLSFINFRELEDLLKSESDESSSSHSSNDDGDETSVDTLSDQSNNDFVNEDEDSVQSNDEEEGDDDVTSDNMLDQNVSTLIKYDEKEKMERAVVEILYEMLQTYPAAIELH